MTVLQNVHKNDILSLFWGKKIQNHVYDSTPGNDQCLEKHQVAGSWGHVWAADILPQWSVSLCDEMTFEQNLKDMRERVKWISGRKCV